MKLLITSLRLVVITMLVCVAGYTAIILGFAQMVVPARADGSLVTKDGKIVGSRLIAQKFTQPQYFWPRPSAADYNAAGAGGSNKSPTSSDLTDRAQTNIVASGATAENPLPAELAAASGSGLDPHITEHAVLYQTERVAKARGLALPKIEALVKQQAFATDGVFVSDRLVNVLELNMALDETK
ncbi:MAG: Potassium-transporting ATPase KdpC subunit [Verrucomicrobiae bacterium]|nr:Potassium-transporting ATPase KdpC subunit [Verrucomicrobiae bacterium]